MDRSSSRDAAFIANVTAPSLFDWIPLGGETGISTVIQSGSQDGIFDFSAPATVGGPLLQQLQLLPTGDYVIEARTIDLDQAETARPSWVLICTNGRELGRVEAPNSSENGGVFRGRFTVNAGCPAQYLRLVARPSNAIGGLSGAPADEVSLRSRTLAGVSRCGVPATRMVVPGSSPSVSAVSAIVTRSTGARGALMPSASSPPRLTKGLIARVR